MGKPFKERFRKWRDKYRLVILNDDNFEEKLSIKLSRLNVFLIVSLGSIFLIVITILIVAFTPLREYIPGYSSTALKRQAFQTALQADSLERQLSYYENYLAIIRSVIDDEPLEHLSDTGSREQSTTADVTLSPGPSDSVLRSMVEQEDMFTLRSADLRHSPLSSYAFFRPVNGEISQEFSAEDNHYAIDIVTRRNEPVKACLQGTVLFAEFSTQTGYVIALQHSANLISIYKHNAAVLKKQGDIVRAGEVIGIVGNTGELSTGPHLHFELWYEGRPVNPLNYISF